MQVSGQINTITDRSYMFNTNNLVMFNDDIFDFIPMEPLMMMKEEKMKQVNVLSSSSCKLEDNNDINDND